MGQKKKGKFLFGLKRNLVRLATLPLVFAGIVFLIAGYILFYNKMSEQVENELRTVAMAVLYNNADLYEEQLEFTIDEKGNYVLSNIDTSDRLEYMGYLKAQSGADSTLFYHDVRIVTTIKDEEGNTIAGTAASNVVSSQVYAGETVCFFDNTVVNGKQFYAYYAPVLNKSGQCVGMVFAGKPTDVVKMEIMKSIYPYLAIILVLVFVMGFIGLRSAKKLGDTIEKEKAFLGEISKGNLRANLDPKILKRNDELGEMGKFAIHVQKFIRDMIEKDTLTKLFTRRIGEIKMQYSQTEYVDSGSPYCIAMADIDHFKNFNDTYGHECGDLVLKSAAGAINRELYGRGYAIRWGGEEFIIVFEDTKLEDAVSYLEDIRKAVINTEVDYNGSKLKVTMTFGLISGDDRALNDLIKEVDTLMYKGKEAGRDRIVY